MVNIHTLEAPRLTPALQKGTYAFWSAFLSDKAKKGILPPVKLTWNHTLHRRASGYLEVRRGRDTIVTYYESGHIDVWIPAGLSLRRLANSLNLYLPHGISVHLLGSFLYIRGGDWEYRLYDGFAIRGDGKAIV